MGIDFGQIHNLVRTYQRVLDLDTPSSSHAEQAAHEDDRVSISEEARLLRNPDKHQVKKPDPPDTGR
ncbi:MAG: hypothetical protein HY205_03445 [Nitrospirae bacterium]|nr:hypothetical protein [Nitrospirota bacterium]